MRWRQSCERWLGSGTIRVIDVLILTKAVDGTVEATELSDSGELGELQVLAAELGELLAADDVDHLAAAMVPGSTAGVLIRENLWAVALRIGGAAFGRPADRWRTDSRAGDHRLDPSRRGKRDRRRLKVPLGPARAQESASLARCMAR